LSPILKCWTPHVTHMAFVHTCYSATIFRIHAYNLHHAIPLLLSSFMFHTYSIHHALLRLCRKHLVKSSVQLAVELTYNFVTSPRQGMRAKKFALWEWPEFFSLKLNPSLCEILITLYKLKSYLVGPVGCHNLWCWAIDIYKEILTAWKQNILLLADSFMSEVLNSEHVFMKLGVMTDFNHIPVKIVCRLMRWEIRISIWWEGLKRRN